MRIRKVETIPVSVPPRAPLGMAGYTVTTHNYLMLRIHTDEEIVGVGESSIDPLWGFYQYYGETQGTVDYVVKRLSRSLIDEDPSNIGRIRKKLDSALPGHPYAKYAIEMALYDLLGKALKVPVHTLLGGCYREKIPACASVGIKPLEERVGSAVDLVQKRHLKTIKLKAGRDPEEDLEALKRVREAVGDKINIKIDGNQGYSPKVAIRTIKRMERYNPVYVEQPSAAFDYEGHARIAQAVETPIFLDEGIWTPQDMQRIIEKRAADGVVIYVSSAYGLDGAVTIAKIADTAGIEYVLGGMGSLGVARTADFHCCAALPNLSRIGSDGTNCQQITHIEDSRDLIKEFPSVYTDGFWSVPNKPGLGVELDEEKIQKYKSKTLD